MAMDEDISFHIGKSTSLESNTFIVNSLPPPQHCSKKFWSTFYRSLSLITLVKTHENVGQKFEIAVEAAQKFWSIRFMCRKIEPICFYDKIAVGGQGEFTVKRKAHFENKKC